LTRASPAAENAIAAGWVVAIDAGCRAGRIDGIRNRLLVLLLVLEGPRADRHGSQSGPIA